MAQSSGSTIVVPSVVQTQHYLPMVAKNLYDIANQAKNDITKMSQRGNGALVSGNLAVTGVFLRDSSVIHVTREAAAGTLGNGKYCVRRTSRTNDNGNGGANGSFTITSEDTNGAVASAETSVVAWSINY